MKIQIAYLELGSTVDACEELAERVEGLTVFGRRSRVQKDIAVRFIRQTGRRCEHARNGIAPPWPDAYLRGER